MSGIDLSQSWSDAPMWVKAWFVLGAIALVGGVSWDRVTMQATADAFVETFPARCQAMDFAAADPQGICGCLFSAIEAEYGRGRLLARQSAYWDAASLAEMAREADCGGR